MVTLSPPTSEARCLVPGTTTSGKAASCLPLVGLFTVQNLGQLYLLVSSALLTTRRDMTCTVFKAT